MSPYSLTGLGTVRGVRSGGKPASAAGAAAAPSGSLARLVIVVAVHPRNGPGIGVGWRGVTFGVCPLLRSGCVSATMTRATA
jgi:hypothetical protein